jgi:predicted SpoU family rRNA methylase
MKEEKIKKKGGGFSRMAAAFATGAAAGIAVGVLISSDKSTLLREKVKSLVKEFGGEWEDSHSHGYDRPDNPV